MEEKNNSNLRIPSFSVILIMVVLMVVGAALLPKLNIQYSPRSVNNNVSVWFSYNGASSRVVEQEVTSIIEGALNSLEGVINVSANSYQGSGNVTLTFKKGTKMEAARYSVATQIRQIYDKLPEGVSYPAINSSISGNSNSMTLLSYTINADMPADRIVKYAQDLIVTPLSRIEGVESVRTSGARPFEWLLTFDPNSLRAVGLAPADLSAAFNDYYRNSIVGSSVIGDRLMLIKLRTEDLNVDLERIPVKKVNGRLFYLGDFAKVFRDQCELTIDNTGGSEVLYEVAMGSGASNSRGDVGWAIGVPVTNASSGKGTTTIQTCLSPTYYFSFDPRDIRRDATCAVVQYETELLPKLSGPRELPIGKWNRLWTPGLTTGSAKSTGINWPLMRYPDVLLMFAEAENEVNGPTQAAKDALKAVRSRAFQPTDHTAMVHAYVDALGSKDDFRNAIVDERAWEFGGECLRKWDLVRWNLYAEKIDKVKRTIWEMGRAARGIDLDLP